MMLAAPVRYLSGLAALVAGLVWAYWPTFVAMTEKWSNDAQYSHGFLVPGFAAYLLWHRRNLLPESLPSTNVSGLILIAIGFGMHLVGAYLYVDAVGMASLLPVLTGLCISYGGWPMLRWALPSIAFLAFM